MAQIMPHVTYGGREAVGAVTVLGRGRDVTAGNGREMDDAVTAGDGG
jgi:hypothetical protein